MVHNSITPLKFAPNEGVVSLNEPASNTSINTHVDLTYPFCEPSTRDNSSLDFYHLLLFGVFSNNHPQIFTACTLQEPGDFLRGSNMNGKLGHLVICVYRSWGFKQKETIQEFATDEGVPYWYNRDTGQTYWEKPFAEVNLPMPRPRPLSTLLRQ